MKKFKSLSVLLILLLLVVGCGCNKKKNEIKKTSENPNKPIINYEKVGNLKIGTSSFYISGNYTYISVSIINETNQDITPASVTAVLKDEAGNVLATELIPVGVIKANDKVEVTDHPIVGIYTTTASISFIIK